MAKKQDQDYWQRVDKVNSELPKYRKAIFSMFYPTFDRWVEWDRYMAGKKNEALLEMLERIVKNLDKFRKINQ
jgi:hypothetical protein